MCCATIRSVPFRLSPLAVSVSIVIIHVLGDAISPAIFGAILDWTNGDWQATMICMNCWLIWCSVFWGAAYYLADKKAKEGYTHREGALFDDTPNDSHRASQQEPPLERIDNANIYVDDTEIDTETETSQAIIAEMPDKPKTS